MSWESLDLKCQCGHTFEDLVKRSERDEAHLCPECGKESAYRCMSVPNVSTDKLSTAIPDVVARGRFNHIREEQALKKMKSDARVSRDRATEKKLDAEIKKVRKK